MINNRIGCIKGGERCWDAAGRELPEIFKKAPMWLDELDQSRGRLEDEIMSDCGIMCEINYQDSQK